MSGPATDGGEPPTIKEVLFGVGEDIWGRFVDEELDGF